MTLQIHRNTRSNQSFTKCIIHKYITISMQCMWGAFGKAKVSNDEVSVCRVHLSSLFFFLTNDERTTYGYDEADWSWILNNHLLYLSPFSSVGMNRVWKIANTSIPRSLFVCVCVLWSVSFLYRAALVGWLNNSLNLHEFDIRRGCAPNCDMLSLECPIRSDAGSIEF